MLGGIALIIDGVGRCIVYLTLGGSIVCNHSYTCRAPVIYPPPSPRLEDFQMHINLKLIGIL